MNNPPLTTQTSGTSGPTRSSSLTFPPATPISVTGQPQFAALDPRNIVIFGETGVGKSSVINLIAGQGIAQTSNDAHGCTFHHERYLVMLNNVPYALWDTTGLDEGSEGTVPADLAAKNLKELMKELANSGGINLIIYCIRCTRLTKALRRNYDLFYVTVCQEKVPVALVVTGLEYQEPRMETWWTENEGALRRNGMEFGSHACVTTVDIEDATIRQRREESQKLLRNLVIQNARLVGWNGDSSFMSRVLPLFQSIFRGTSSVVTTPGPRKVTIYGSFTEFLPGSNAVWSRSTCTIGNRIYEFQRVDKNALFAERLGSSEGVSTAGLFVFYTYASVNNRISQSDSDALKRLYDAAKRHRCPIIIALQTPPDGRTAGGCRVEIPPRHSDVLVHSIHIPSTNDGRGKLDGMIESTYTEQVEVKPPKLKKTHGY